MGKDELRPCIVKFDEITSVYVAGNGKLAEGVAKEAETHSGWFHTWASEQCMDTGLTTGVYFYGIVEYEDGTVHKVPINNITFTDRN